jgi:hypothetical protein
LRFIARASGNSMMRYGLNAAIIAGEICPAPGESARTTGDRSDHLPGWHEMTPPAGLHIDDDVNFHDGRTNGGVKLRPDGRRIAGNFVNRPWRCRPFEMAVS